MSQTTLLEQQRKTTIIKDCSTCIISQYHNSLPEKITTKDQKYRDEVLTIVCRTCNNHCHHHAAQKNKELNDRFVNNLELELRKKLGNNNYEDELKKMEKEQKSRAGMYGD